MSRAILDLWSLLQIHTSIETNYFVIYLKRFRLIQQETKDSSNLTRYHEDMQLTADPQMKLDSSIDNVSMITNDTEKAAVVSRKFLI